MIITNKIIIVIINSIGVVGEYRISDSLMVKGSCNEYIINLCTHVVLHFIVKTGSLILLYFIFLFSINLKNIPLLPPLRTLWDLLPT